MPELPSRPSWPSHPILERTARLGRYVVLKHLASGGMADVFIGRSDGLEGFERHVVLKRIRSEHARDQRFIRMFLSEARVAATLHHQHIVQVYDVGESDGEYFIAMEYVHGQDVRKILATAARQHIHVPLAQAIAIVSAAAAGLHYAHERCGADKHPLNIVHRDISPSNLLVGYDGSIKVVDFGVATASLSQETKSRSAHGGKVSYMSPEQCVDDRVDRRSDVYALGVVLYELATTTRMVSRESDYLMMEQIVHGRITPPESRRPDLPIALSAIIMRALATKREDRYATADELRIALEQFASSAGLTAPPSAVAAYLRQVFGYQLEPWLEFPKQATRADDGPTRSIPPGALPPHAPADEPLRGTHPQSNGRMRLSPEQVPAPQDAASPAAPPDAAPDAPRPRRFALPRAALIAAPIVVIAGSALWWLDRGQRHDAATSPKISSAAPVTPAPPARNPGSIASATANPTAAAAPVPAAPATAPAAAPTRSAPVPAEASPREAPPAVTARPPRAVPAKRVATIKVEPPERARKRPHEGTATSPAPTPAPAAANGSAFAMVASPPPPKTAPEQPVALPAPELPPANPVPPPRAAPPSPAPATGAPVASVRRVVVAAVLEANRISGEIDIAPDDASRARMRSDGKNTAVGAYKICLGADGGIETVSLLRSTGYPAYDAKIASTIFTSWRYRPVLVDGRPGPVCSGAKVSWSTTAKLGNKPTWR